MATSHEALSYTQIQELPLWRRGKVRDVYEVNSNQLLIVATDRISAFDVVLPTLIPRKGEVLTQLSCFWFELMKEVVPNHLISADAEALPAKIGRHAASIRRRSMLVHKTEPIPFECVVRGYLVGSGWAEYSQSGSVCGIRLPAGLSEASELVEPIFTPATKAAEGHDINISEEEMANQLGRERVRELRDLSLTIYARARGNEAARGILIADTKFEFGLLNDQIIWIDEALTPDSSRFWSADQYRRGTNPPSFDKQFVRDYLNSIGWDHAPPAPSLPANVVHATSEKYLEAYKLLTGNSL